MRFPNPFEDATFGRIQMKLQHLAEWKLFNFHSCNNFSLLFFLISKIISNGMLNYTLLTVIREESLNLKGWKMAQMTVHVQERWPLSAKYPPVQAQQL